MSTLHTPGRWPELPYPEWAETKKTLQLYTQIAGKIKLALEAPRPEWVGSALCVTSRGLTTGPMPWGTSSVEVVFDLLDHTLSLFMSDGRSRTIPLIPARCVAEVYKDVMEGLNDYGVGVDIWTKPQEVPDATPLEENRHNRTYEPEHARKFFSVITAVANVLDEWSAKLFCRNSVQFWWGSFDLSVLVFTGKHAEPPADANYIMRYDLDAEFMTAGFWPGNDEAPDPGFYAYLYPPPAGVASAVVRPDAAGWSEPMGEWMMRYDDLRESARPERDLVQFLDSVLEAAGSLGGWDLGSFEYEAPPVRRVSAPSDQG
jgi:hypothetical protein